MNRFLKNNENDNWFKNINDYSPPIFRWLYNIRFDKQAFSLIDNIPEFILMIQVHIRLE